MDWARHVSRSMPDLQWQRSGTRAALSHSEAMSDEIREGSRIEINAGWTIDGAQGCVREVNHNGSLPGSGVDLLIDWDAGGCWWIDLNKVQLVGPSPIHKRR